MPYKSEAQRKYFNANRKKLEAEGVDVDHWNTESKGKKLPKKANFLSHLLTTAGGVTGNIAGPYANEKLKLGLSPRTARIGGTVIGSLGTGLAQLVARKSKKKKKKKRKQAEKASFDFSSFSVGSQAAGSGINEQLRQGIKKLTNQADWYADKYKRMGPEATLGVRLGAGLAPLPFYAALSYKNKESLKPVAANALTTAALAPLLAYGLGGNKDRMKNLTDVRAYADTVPLAVGGGALAHVLTRLLTDPKPNAAADSPEKKEDKEMSNIQELAKAAAITDYMPGFKNLATGFNYGKQQSRARDLEAQRQELVGPKMPAGNSLMDRIKKNTQMRKDMGIHRNAGLLGTTKAGSIAEIAKLAASCGSHGGKKKKKKKAADLAKLAAGRCWDGYEPVPGKDAYSDDSCRKIGSKKKKKTKKA